MNKPQWVSAYYQILHKIHHAATNQEFLECEDELSAFFSDHSRIEKGWGLFKWYYQDKSVHSAWEGLQHQLLFRMNYVYDSSQTFGR